MKAIRVFLYIIIGVAVLYYLAARVNAPIHKAQELNQIATSDTSYIKKYSAIAKYKELLPLVKEKAYREAQLYMSKNDSIGMVINFRDSSANLMLKGVCIQTSKLVDFKKDKIFDGVEAPAFRKIFSKPLHNIDEFSTFAKVPIIIKKAPKDTIEAMRMATLPVEPPIDPAYVKYDLEYGIKLLMIQDSCDTPEELVVENMFKTELRKQKSDDLVSSLVNIGNPKYTPTIVLTLSGKDVRSIYRALPEKADFVMIFEK
ncbi:MAG TPA: hypothetical protein PKH79_02240 [Prolixibacteraceae bacterium]|nr:hypothetical protein [Prolixibacteraceae bacterium]